MTVLCCSVYLNVELKKLFALLWNQFQDHIYFQVKTTMNDKLDKHLAPIKEILRTLLVDLLNSHTEPLAVTPQETKAYRLL